MKKYLLLLALVCLLGNRGLAQNRSIIKQVTETIDFSIIKQSGDLGNGRLSWDNGHPSIDGQIVSERITVENTSYWGLRGSDVYAESYFQKNDRTSTTNVYLSGIKVGDVVTIWGEVGNTESGDFNIPNNFADLSNTTYTENVPIDGTPKTVPNSKEYRITGTDNGSVTVQLDGNWSGIRKITIQSTVRAEDYFNYDPGYEEYDMYDEFSENDPKKYELVRGQINSLNPPQYSTEYTLSTEATGITLNGQPAQYIVLSGSKITANNRIAIYPYNNWRFNYGLRAPSSNNNTWANFSICNLREGDRVVFSYTGTAPKFSSNGENGTYDGCKAFADLYNDGIYDEGVDLFIASNPNPQTDWQRGEGAIYMEDHNGNQGDYQLIYTQSYVITEDGHLDLAIAPDTRIVKIKIYSDHQAMMVDKPGKEEFSNMSYFNITGELQANEHIVPGGLEVHVGSNDASQHAHVVSSLEGPVSIINGVDGFKLPGMSGSIDDLQFEFDLANNIPTTGTFYKFMPVEDGKMTVRFQAASMNYYRYDLRGDAVYYGDVSNFGDNSWAEVNDRPNEQTVNVPCPYYVKVSTDDGYEDVEEITWDGVSSGTGGSSEPTEQDLWTNVNDGRLSLSDIENAGGADDDIITFYLSVNGGDSQDGWGMGGLTSSNNGNHDPRYGNGIEFIRQGNSWTQTYTVAQLKDLANNSGGIWVTLWNNAVLPRVTLTTSGGTSSTKELDNGEVIEFEIDVKAGKTYYLYGGWNASSSDLEFNGSGQGNNTLEYFPYGNGNNGGTMKACGVAKLLWVEYSPDNNIAPLAKWVPNNTPGVYKDETGEYGVPNPDEPSYDSDKLEYELADIKGYIGAAVTVKKMSGNITGCTPFIWRAKPDDSEGKLMIKGIKFAEGKDKGGTILIKIGNPSVRSNPVYTLTIAYSADPQFDGNEGRGARGYSWDYSSNSLHGLKWASPHNPNGAETVDYGHYFKNYFDPNNNISQYSSKDEVLSSLETSGEGLLYDEIHEEMTNGANADWAFNYNLQNAGILYDPMFTNKYDMEGDNADMIWETEGTVIKTSANSSVMFNEFTGGNIHASEKDPDRYVGILKGGEFRIPWLMPNDRVIIWMGTGKGAFNDQAVFSIKNAYDAVHNEIKPEDEYIVGGSHWNVVKNEEGQVVTNDPYYRGCYHFFATGDKNNEGKPADMVFKMTGGTMCKIYKIQIYRGDRIITNEVVANNPDTDKFLLWSRAKDPNDANDVAAIGPKYNWTLKYFGKDQKLADGNGTKGQKNEIVAQTGNINKTISTDAATNTFTYEHGTDEIGTFRMRGKDMEKNMNYVADYADHNVTVALQETQKYPYTWDFMDMTGYEGDPTDDTDGNVNQLFIPEEAIGEVKPSDLDESVWSSLAETSYQRTARDLSLWEVNSTNGYYFLRLNSQVTPPNGTSNPKDNIFETAKAIYGNQVWANGEVIPETQGLWFYTENNTQRDAAKWTISDYGMNFYGDNHTVVVPNVPKDAAVYLRMVKIPDENSSYTYQFKDKDGNIASGSEYLVYTGEVEVSTIDESTGEESTSKEYILAIKNNGTTKKHFILSIGGYELKKLGVSTDPKAVNTKGWTSESRDHAIDAALTPYLTGKPIKTYFAGQPNYGNRTLVLTDISTSQSNYVMPAGTGCVLFNEAAKDYQNVTDYIEGKVEIFDGGFHLFVPDMHDGEKLANPNATTTSGAKVNMLKPQLTKVDKMAEGDDTNTYYVLSYKYYDLDADGNKKSNTAIAGPEMFYRVAKTGIGMKANSAYLALPTSEVKPKSRETVEAPAKCYSFVFADYDDFFSSNLNGIATEIEEVETVTPQTVQEGWYTINGQKLSGRPTTSGLYIVNGKKVLVK